MSGSATASFAYDPFGRREQATINSTTTSCLYDGRNFIEDLSGNTSTTTYRLGLGLNERYARTDPTGTQSYLTDVLGSVTGLANSSGTVQTTYTYDPFGQTTTSGASSSNPYQYIGAANDGTGLEHDLARYYNPGTAQFVSPDPLGQAGSGPTLYQYASDNPVNQPDPTCLSSRPGIFTGPGVCLVSVLSGVKDGAAAAGCAVGTALLFMFPEAPIGDALVLDLEGLSATEAARLLRQYGESLIAGTGNTERIWQGSKYFIPDILDPNSWLIGEVKNVGYQAYTSQLRAFVSYAQSRGYAFNLYVRQAGYCALRPLAASRQRRLD